MSDTRIAFDQDSFIAALDSGEIVWTRHGAHRARENGIDRATVLNILREGDRIEEYPDDFPYPNALFLGWVDELPVHIVAAFDTVRRRAHIITVYVANLEHFEQGYRVRRSR